MRDIYKNKKRTYGDNVCINLCSLNVPKDGVECETYSPFQFILLVYENKYNQQVYLQNCANKIVNTQIIDYLDDNLFDSDENLSYK